MDRINLPKSIKKYEGIKDPFSKHFLAGLGKIIECEEHKSLFTSEGYRLPANAARIKDPHFFSLSIFQKN